MPQAIIKNDNKNDGFFFCEKGKSSNWHIFGQHLNYYFFGAAKNGNFLETKGKKLQMQIIDFCLLKLE